MTPEELLAFAADLEARGVPALRRMLDRNPLQFAEVFDGFVKPSSAILFGELTDEHLARIVTLFARQMRARARRGLN